MFDVAIKRSDAAIVRGALVLARELGMEAVAEGVETAEQLDFLLSAGCCCVQGYFFGRPLPAADIGALLRKSGFLGREAARKLAG